MQHPSSHAIPSQQVPQPPWLRRVGLVLLADGVLLLEHVCGEPAAAAAHRKRDGAPDGDKVAPQQHLRGKRVAHSAQTAIGVGSAAGWPLQQW